MAVAIVALASAMAMVVLSSSARSEMITKQGDQGTSVAAAALQTAALLDCGATTALLPSGSGDLSDPTNPQLGALTSRTKMCAPPAKGAIGDLGDVRWRESVGSVLFDVQMRTNWVLFDPRASTTTAGAGTDGPSCTSERWRLRRDVVVTWTAAGRRRTRTLSQLAAPPPDDISGTNRGCLTYGRVPLRNGQPGTVTLSLGNGFGITHTADARGIVRFPFLTLGASYPVSVNGVARTPVTLNRDNPVAVRQV